jgi:hypothetical protein
MGLRPRSHHRHHQHYNNYFDIGLAPVRTHFDRIVSIATLQMRFDELPKSTNLKLYEDTTNTKDNKPKQTTFAP